MTIRRKVTNAGERVLCQRMTRQDGVALKVRLFHANVTPSDSVTLTQLTAPTWTGYADFTLNDDDWTDAETNPDNRAAGEYPEIQWTYASATSQSIYGAAIYESGTNIVITIELFDSPIVAVGDGTIAFAPRLLVFDTADVAV